MDGNLSMNSYFENLPEEAMKEQENNISPIDGLSVQEFEKLRDQIIEYIKMYRTDGEPICAWKIMKLFEPFITKSTQHE
jgi:predicted Zn-dependent peptidase